MWLEAHFRASYLGIPISGPLSCGVSMTRIRVFGSLTWGDSTLKLHNFEGAGDTLGSSFDDLNGNSRPTEF